MPYLFFWCNLSVESGKLKGVVCGIIFFFLVFLSNQMEHICIVFGLSFGLYSLVETLDVSWKLL